MSILLLVLGVGIVVFVLVDVLWSTITLRGEGPILAFVSNTLWWVLLWIHRRKANHVLLSLAGIGTVTLVFSLWVLLFWMGWTLIFLADPGSVVDSLDGTPADLASTIYYTGYTLFTLGVGDFRPQGAVWQIVTPLATLTGFFLITLTIAYLIPLVSSAVEERGLAAYIQSLGGTSDGLLRQSWNGENFGLLEQHLMALLPMIHRNGQQHLQYPVLFYFHSRDPKTALTLRLAALDEALIILEYAVPREVRPDQATLHALRIAISRYLETIRIQFLDEEERLAPPSRGLDGLREAGIPVQPESLAEAEGGLRGRRSMLLAVVRHDGWEWDDVDLVSAS
jgi:hypothetical protein